MVDVDGQRILERARELAFPRYPGTDGDRRAIEIVARWFREAGLDVVEEPFTYDIRPAFRAIRLALIASAVTLAVAGAVGWRSPGVGALALGVALVSGGLLLVWSPGAERLYARRGPTSTKNITGYRRSAHPRLRLILMAHHDSKSQNLNFGLRMGSTVVALLGGVALAGVLVAGLIAGAPPGPVWLAPLLGGVSAVALFTLSTLRSGNASPGGVDNAGSVGIVGELALALPGDVAPDVELVFLSTGAEEDHMVGAMRWLDAHREELERVPTYALNFDGAGAPGRTVLIERYGLGRRFSETLSRVARAGARDLGIPFRSIVMLPAIGIDAIPFAHRGLDCLTLASGSLDRATISVHSSKDVADHLDAATLERVARLGREVARRLANGEV